MSSDLKVSLEPKGHSVEGHTTQGTLFFNGRIIWGPRGCHDNTTYLRDALAAADPRFELVMRHKNKSIEGHTCTISVMANGRTYLDRLSTHDSMEGLCKAINDCLAAERERPQPDKPKPAPQAQTPAPTPPKPQPGPNPSGPTPYQKPRPNGRQNFEIAIICALKVEQDAVEALLDEEYEIDGFSYGKALTDTNAYTTGRIGQQAVVLAYMPQMGKESSAIVAAGLRMSFMGVKVAFLVGVCGAAPVDPTPLDPKDREIFLGDVIISTAVIQVDFGRQYPDTFLRKDTLEDSPGRANSEIRAFLQKLKTKRTKRRLEEKMLKYVTGLGADDEYLYPAESSDNLYRSDYRHKHRDGSCQTCAGCNAPNDPVCDNARQAPCHELRCNDGPLVPRTRRTACPVLHFGRFASGDSVMKSGAHRDKIVAKDRVIAFEMEGAGTWDCLPTVIIKSACDYADSHKNKFWQSYASATAAACTKAVLDEWRNNQQ